MDFIRQTMHDNLKNLAHAPSVQLQNVPDSFFDSEQILQDELNPDQCQDNVTISSEKLMSIFCLIPNKINYIIVF